MNSSSKALISIFENYNYIQSSSKKTVFNKTQQKIKLVKNNYDYKLITYYSNYSEKNTNYYPKQPRNYELESSARAKRKVIEYGLNNYFNYFVTITFDVEKIDRYNYELCQKKLLSYLNDYKNCYDNDLKYILIPELHKKKENEKKCAIHFHGLFYLSNENDLKYLFFDKKNGKKIYRNEKLFKKFGANRFVKIYNCSKAVVLYIAKYITKGKKILKSHYFNSQGLKTDTVVIPATDIILPILMTNIQLKYCIQPTYLNDFCKIYIIPEVLARYLIRKTGINFKKFENIKYSQIKCLTI